MEQTPADSTPLPPWHIAPVPPARTRALRRLVFGAPAGGRYCDDPGPDGLHLAALDQAGKVIASGAIERSADAAGWRVRAMAVNPAWRGRGVGAALLAALVDHARARGATHIWCHARVTVEDFYRAAGWVRSGSPFPVPGAPEHVRMELAGEIFRG